MGFKTMGAPNRNGSLTLKRVGIMEARPIAFISLDLARKANMKQITRVAPVPPRQTTKYCEERESTWVACSPAW